MSTQDLIRRQALEKQWVECDAVCFDVDSTVCIDEGIDEFAAFLGKKDEVSAWTSKAMGGGVSFEDALSARLKIMNPNKDQLDEFIEKNPPKLSPGIAELVTTLRVRGKSVFLVSGGFTQMIHPLADILGIPRGNVFANTILFNENGTFSGHDRTAFTSKSGGKPACITFLKGKYGFSSVTMIGDGATDLEACKPGAADLFIGYGGIQKREKVVKEAKWFVTSFDPLIGLLKQSKL
eukprot:TRINITY_DN5138_c6_g1_i1.p1 TRINITY_DN5138_c6_g1~~TRINITY_DN5138_c6_g1_i1.p1  ORF type:complete len:236 (+),score=42.27 TRINITY_DN5138_c6_g1_i1:77-784(+)